MAEERDHSQYEYPPRVPISFLALLAWPGRPLTDQERAKIDRISIESEALLLEVAAILVEADQSRLP